MKILKDCGILEIWNVFYIVIILTCYGGDKWERKGSSWTVIILCQADKGSIVLVSLCHVESLEEGTSIKKKKKFSSYCPVGKPVVRFLDQWLTGEGQGHYGQCHTWSSYSPECAKKGWAHYEEQASEQCTLHRSAPASTPVRIPLRTDCGVKCE